MAKKAIELQVKSRSELGSRANKRLRDAGFIPGVIYGHKEAVIPVTLPRKETSGHIAHGAHVFDLKVDGKSETVLLKDVQYDHLGSEVIHVDFARVDLNERVKVSVPVVLKGTPKGEAEGGVLQQIVSDLDVECLVLEIPDNLLHNVAELELNSLLRVKDLQLPPGLKVLHDADLILATVKEIKEEVVAPVAVEAGAAEPEVIGRKPTDEEAAAEGEPEKKAEKK